MNNSSYSKADKQTRYKFSIFEEYEDVELQKILHLLRMAIDERYYYNGMPKEECIVAVNKIISTYNLDEEDRIEMERKVLYHLSKHIILNDVEGYYNLNETYLKEWL